MITKEAFYELFRAEQACVLCANDDEWQIACTVILDKYPQWGRPYPLKFNAEYPWLCKYEGDLCGYVGGDDHPESFTYEEFMVLHGFGKVPDDDFAGLEELL